MNLNYLAPISGLGYGIISINLLSELSKRLNISTFPIGNMQEPLSHHKDDILKSLNNALTFDYNAPSLRVYHQFDMSHSVGKGMKTGYTFFELNKLTDREKHHLNYLDIVFAPSNWAKQIMIENGITTRIEVVNPGVDLTLLNSKSNTKINTETPNTTIFYSGGKWEIRKGHDFVLEAFNKAFEKTDDVLLISNNFNPIQTPQFNGPEESTKWQYHYNNSKLGLAGKIKVIPNRIDSQVEVINLMNACDCGFFPSRAEGWGLCLAEMLALGKNCIATNYSAFSDFAEKGNCEIVNIYELEDAYEPPFFKENCGQWAKLGQSQLDQTVEYLRKIHKLKQENNLKFNSQAYNIFRSEFTWENAANKVINSIYEI